MSDYQRGHYHGQRDSRDQRWTRADLERHCAENGEATTEYERGYRSGANDEISEAGR